MGKGKTQSVNLSEDKKFMCRCKKNLGLYSFPLLWWFQFIAIFTLFHLGEVVFHVFFSSPLPIHAKSFFPTGKLIKKDFSVKCKIVKELEGVFRKIA